MVTVTRGFPQRTQVCSEMKQIAPVCGARPTTDTCVSHVGLTARFTPRDVSGWSVRGPGERGTAGPKREAGPGVGAHLAGRTRGF